MSSMRMRKRPPDARAISKLINADRAWPRCRWPFGLGAKRKTGVVILTRNGLRYRRNCRCCRPAMSFFIHTEADLDTGIARLIEADPRFGEVLSRAGRPPLRRRADGFAGLISNIVSQQLSVASAA